jgi:translation initiation factor 2D
MELTYLDIDDAFRKAFCFGVYKALQNESAPHYGLTFPLKQSFIMSNLIQPFLPIFSKADSDALVFKKTSWKNIRKFVKSLGQDRLVLVKEWKDEAAILDIDFDDNRFKGFVPYQLPKRDTQPSSGPAQEGLPIDGDPSIGQQLKVKTLYRGKEKLGEVFGDSDYRNYFSALELRNILSAYIEKEQLVAQDNRRMVSLNPVIANNLIGSGNPNHKAFIHRGVIPRDALNEIFLTSCSPFYLILRETAKSDQSQKPKAGHPPKLIITTETRSGNKTVTKVSGLEAYYIPPQPLADELRKTCAGSTSVEKMIGSSDKNPVMEVLVQGPQSDPILRSLQKRGIDKKWVDVVDKTKKKKK